MLFYNASREYATKYTFDKNELGFGFESIRPANKKLSPFMGEGFYVGRVEGEPTYPRGKRAKCQHSVLSGEAGNEASLLARKGE